MAAKTKYKLDQVAIRMVKERPLLSEEAVSSPDAVIRVMNDLLKDYDREVVAVVNLQSDLKPINMNIVSIGTVNASIASPRDILKSVILSNAAHVMLVHNHPSGDLIPSKEDINLTGRMKEILTLMDIDLLDHVIIGNSGRYYSFFENGILPVTANRVWNTVEEIDFRIRPVRTR